MSNRRFFLWPPIGMINQILFTLIPAFAFAEGIHLLNHSLAGAVPPKEKTSNKGSSKTPAQVFFS